MLDQVSPWSIDPELLVDFLFLPDSYFYADSPEKYGNKRLEIPNFKLILLEKLIFF